MSCATFFLATLFGTAIGIGLFYVTKEVWEYIKSLKHTNDR